LGRYLRRRVKRYYAWDRAAAQIETVYRALLAGRPLPDTSFHSAEVRSTGQSLPEKL
jgi:hypothetical protein